MDVWTTRGRAPRRAATVAGLAGAALLAACADMDRPRPPAATAAASARCSQESFPIYFARGSSELQPDSRTVVSLASRRMAGCRITAVDVTGVAAPDAAGAAADPALTQRRANAVAQALVQAGLPSPSFDVQVAGGPQPPSGARTPLPRRTVVVLHAQPAG